MVTLHDVLSAIAGLLWAVGWCAVGCRYAWWIAVGAFFLGGIVGWFLALLGLDLRFYRPPATSRWGILAEVAAFLLGLAGFLALPVAVFLKVRTAS